MCEADEPADDGTQRIDKWLWFARVLKTRSLAARLVTDGSVRLNRQRVDKASAIVRPGDVLTIAVHGRVRVLKVVRPGIRRGPAAEAQTLFEDLSPERAPGAAAAIQPKATPVAEREPGSGRPTKRQRRDTDKLIDS